MRGCELLFLSCQTDEACKTVTADGMPQVTKQGDTQNPGMETLGVQAFETSMMRVHNDQSAALGGGKGAMSIR